MRPDHPADHGRDAGDDPAPDLVALRAALLVDREHTVERISTLTGNVASIVDAASFTATDDEHDPEGATIAFERSQAGALLAASVDHLADIDRALAQIDEGGYGRCERCGGLIAQARLLARPAARTCIACAT